MTNDESSTPISPQLDNDDAPALGDEFFANATLRIGDDIVRRGAGPISRLPRRGRPPKGSATKVQQSLRLSPEVLDWFRATGGGWQARIDAVLLAHVRGEADRRAA